MAPGIAAAIAVVATGLLVGVFNSFWATLAFAVAAFSLTVMVREFYSGARARQSLDGGTFFGSLGRLVSRNRRRYGGYIVHIGMATLLIGVAASGAFNTKVERPLAVGQTIKVGDYNVKYVKATSNARNERLSFGAVLATCSKDGKHVTTLLSVAQLLPAEPNKMGLIGRYFGGEAETTKCSFDAGPLDI